MNNLDEYVDIDDRLFKLNIFYLNKYMQPQINYFNPLAIILLIYGSIIGLAIFIKNFVEYTKIKRRIKKDYPDEYNDIIEHLREYKIQKKIQKKKQKIKYERKTTLSKSEIVWFNLQILYYDKYGVIKNNYFNPLSYPILFIELITFCIAYIIFSIAVYFSPNK